MKYSKTAMLNFMALCCILGIFTKKLINPIANTITQFLRIPGGVSTGFSIMYLVIGAEIVKASDSHLSAREKKYCATSMSLVQGLLALVLGRVGSMGIFMPLSFLATGIVIDFVYVVSGVFCFDRKERMVFSNALAAVTASVTANIIVFHLPLAALGLYLCVSALSGSLFGLLGEKIAGRVLMGSKGKKKEEEY